VPTIEIARVFSKYKNSVLRFNPRSYLGLRNNPVNAEITKTIKEIKTNEFALFNNGITILSDGTDITEFTGMPNRAQLRITNPEIINGGQTGFALHQIYEEEVKKGGLEECFQDKEVLVKVITFVDSQASEESPQKLQLIESISKATNQQTNVTEADRRSNDKIQIEIQKRIYEEFGCFYERKRGEFWDGINNKYIDNRQVIDREVFMRICIACNGLASQARRSSERVLFSQDKFYGTLKQLEKIRQYFFGYTCYEVLNEIEKKFEKDAHNKFGMVNYGNGIRYGKMAVVSVVSRKFDDAWRNNELREKAVATVNMCLSNWLDFESFITKQTYNMDYFRTYYDNKSKSLISELDFDNYYKGRNVNKDLEKFFTKKL
ncbi:AIPR family protein, partial [Chloroflexota bacterium]